MKQSALFPNASETSKTPSILNVLQGLDRSEVEPLASKILEIVKPWCVRAEVAGSFRRGRAVVNDLDIVLQPTPSVLSGSCWRAILHSIRSEFDPFIVKQGDKLASFDVPFLGRRQQGYVQVDLYRAEPTTWGILLLVRTGSKEHNVKLCDLAIQRGLSLQYSVGLTDKSGRVIAGRSEEEVFQALGLPFIAPNEREV